MVLSSWSLFAMVHVATDLYSPELDLFRFRSSVHLIYIFDDRKAIFGDFGERKSMCVCVQWTTSVAIAYGFSLKLDDRVHSK